MSEQHYKSKSEFVDEFSLKMEKIGHPRIYGQILGWLLICDPPHQSFPDLMENLGISKASVSNITRILLESGKIEKVRITGERQIYFKIKDGSAIDFMERQMHLTNDLKDISAKALQLIEEKNDTDCRRLRKVHEFHTFLSNELPSLIEKFKKNHTS